MSILIVHDHDNWPLEQIKFDPSNPGELPEETYQYVSYAPESEKMEHKRVRYVVRPSWNIAESKLSIAYHAEDQRYLPEGWPSREDVEFWAWGVHVLTIEPGTNSGPSCWQHVRSSEPEPEPGPGWRLETVSGGPRNREPGTIWAIQREQSQFRQSLLAMDGCCALTGETCETALEAAHIIPAHQGGPEYPENGMLLRADVHRLFDAGKFRICPENGNVQANPNFDYPSFTLQEAQVPEGVLERIRTALEERLGLPEA